MMDEPDLVTLFCHADWTRLSLSAEVIKRRRCAAPIEEDGQD
jgi:hypothetical protein